MKQEQVYPSGEAMVLNVSHVGGRHVALDGKGLAVGLPEDVARCVFVSEVSGIAEVTPLEYACRLASVRGVSPEEVWRGERMAAVSPLAPREVAGREVRWEVVPDLWLVHAGSDEVYLRRAAIGDWKGTAHLSFDGARRLVQALVGLCRWQQRLAQVMGGSAEEERLQLERQLHAAERASGVIDGER
jgi:hypothetical protein